MADRKVSISKSDLQGHSRAWTMALVPFNIPTYDFLLGFYCNYVSLYLAPLKR